VNEIVSPVRFVAFVLVVGLACWLIWPSSSSTSSTSSTRVDSAGDVKTASTRSNFHGTAPEPALSTDDDGNIVSLPEDATADRIRVEGIVMDEKKTAIGGAIVHVGLRETTAEADGTFAFDDVAAGSIILRAERGEWYGEESTYVSDTSDPIEVTVRRGSTLVLHVVEKDGGAPIANAKVEVARRELYTNAKGTIRTRGLDPTGERLTVSADGFGTWRGDVDLDTERPTAEKEMTVALASGAPVSGIVVDERGERVPEAWVSIRAIAKDGWSDAVSANERGEFTLPAISPGKHTMYATSKRHLAAPEIIVEHDGVRPTTGIVIEVKIGAELVGRVVDAAGNPVAGATIRGVPGSDTDVDGRFVATGIDPGEITLSAYIDNRSSEETKVTMVAGKQTEVRFVVRDASLAGRVVDRQGNPVAAAQLWARATDESNTFFAASDEYGKFDFGGMPPGDYRVIAQHEEEVRRSLPDDAKVFRTGRRDLTIVLPALASITGRVVLDGSPVRYFGVLVTKTPDKLYFESVTTVNDDAGAFAQNDIAPGAWSVVILGPGFATKTIANVVTHDGQPTDLGTIVVERGRVVRGRVTDGNNRPVPGALVVAGSSLFSIASSRVDQRVQGDTSTRTDADGRYELVGVPTEDLRIVARTATASAVERTLAPDETAVNFVLQEVGTVVGHIANVQSSQIGVVLTLADEDVMSFGPRYYGDIDRAGGFRVANVPPGRYKVRVMGENTLPLKEVAVVANRTTQVELEMPAVQIDVIVAANECDLLSLTGPDVHATETCSDNVATWKAVGPGSYEVCGTGDGDPCQSIRVAASPAEQRFEVRFPAQD
jgi:protocatechuate 3,4-dioxygenase beta subunit